MTESVKKFKAEMEQRGLFRKITVAVNLVGGAARAGRRGAGGGGGARAPPSLPF